MRWRNHFPVQGGWHFRLHWKERGCRHGGYGRATLPSDLLKAQGHSWSPEECGRPKSWYPDVADADKAAEVAWLRKNVIGPNQAGWALRIAARWYSDRCWGWGERLESQCLEESNRVRLSFGGTEKLDRVAAPHQFPFEHPGSSASRAYATKTLASFGRDDPRITLALVIQCCPQRVRLDLSGAIWLNYSNRVNRLDWEGELVASVIIGIHGLANKRPADEKKEWWKSALIEGLKRNCGKTTDELSFDFVYWADLRYNLPVSLELNPEPYYPDQGAGTFPAYQTHKWVAVFNEITSVIGKEVNFLDLHTGIDKVGDFVLERELQDLAAYYEDKDFRTTARQRLIDKLREHAGKRIMLIGHSMGSIIAYDVLRIIGRQPPPVPIDHFVTIGSPLGLPHVKTKIYEENDLVRTPSIVGRWTNFADRRDVVAVEAKLGDDYEANDQGVKVADVPVINAYKSPPDRVPPNKPNFHKSYGYLRTPELSNVVRGFV